MNLIEPNRPYKSVTYIGDVKGTITAIVHVANEPENLEAAKEPAYILKTFGAKRLFYRLKSELSFTHDPEGLEYIQGANALLQSLQGDCDCFTCLMVSIMIVAKLPFYILLYGNDRTQPTHIAISIYCPIQKQFVNFDLTTNKFNAERLYKFKQPVPIQIQYA
jgi:hypothetical protein